MKKLPIVRHIRWFWLRFLLNCHVEKRGALCASEFDIKYLEDVRRGEQ